LTRMERPAVPRGFVVDRDHPGTPESAWASSPHMAGLPPLVIADVRHAVVVAPHPDDEVLGAGGLLQLLAQAGATIEICAVTDGEGSHPSVDTEVMRRVRTVESVVALGRLGMAHVERNRLGFPDGKVSEYETQLGDFLARRLGPDSLCVAPWTGEGHPDHDACGRAAVAAAHQTGAGLVEYLVWAWHWADPLGADLPWPSCRKLKLSRRSAGRKRWATTAFKSQISPFGPRLEPPVLPDSVLRRFWRPFEVFVT
jgi:LmbE family N-acetylglucosaminyl deacetylase